MSTEAVYSQAPLVTERREIRILVLAPGTGNDVLRGELIVESLDYDDLHYTALSYTWSGSVGENFISIRGAPLHITENLSMALRRIRGPTRPRNMWIDAISINQGDFEEKAVQVNLMGEIYSSATRTIVWLGEKSADSDVAMDLIGSLRQGTPDQLDDDKRIEQRCWRAINDLMQRKWWTRIWVIQEALMSRRVIVHCGEKRVDIVNFVKLLGESRVEQNPEQPSPSSENPFKEILSNWYVHKNQVESSGESLQALLFLTHGFQASLWRDRIFALLGLATPEARSCVTPDYSYDVPDRLILIRLTMYFLRTSLQPLRPLKYASLCRATDCPSWVADWTAIDSSLERRVNEANDTRSWLLQFKAAEYYPQFEPPIENLTRYEEPSALLVRGFVVCRVEIAVQIPHLDSITSAEGTQAKSIKTKLREWELRMMEYFELAWSRTDDPRTRGQQMITQINEKLQSKKNRVVETKALLIHYLCKGVSWESPGEFGRSGIRLPEDWFQRLQILPRRELYFHGSQASSEKDREIHYGELISDYEEWMQCFPSGEHAELQSQGICNLCEHTCKRVEEGMCAHCVTGQALCKNNAGLTMFVTENAYHRSATLAVQEGDIICALLSSEELFVMRKADEIHWTLVGTLATPYVNDGYEFWHLTRSFRENRAEAEAKLFRLR